MSSWDESYNEAASRCYQDGQTLYKADRYPNACHLFGLATECALKAAMEKMPGAMRDLPHKHLPDLKDDERRWFSGRRFNGLRILLGKNDYMQDWAVDNRYWPEEAFSQELCETYRDHARRTLMATGSGGII